MAPTSIDFIQNEHDLLILAEAAALFHCRPSEMLRGRVEDFQLDLTCAQQIWKARGGASEDGNVIEW